MHFYICHLIPPTTHTHTQYGVKLTVGSKSKQVTHLCFESAEERREFIRAVRARTQNEEEKAFYEGIAISDRNRLALSDRIKEQRMRQARTLSKRVRRASVMLQKRGSMLVSPSRGGGSGGGVLGPAHELKRARGAMPAMAALEEEEASDSSGSDLSSDSEERVKKAISDHKQATIAIAEAKVWDEEAEPTRGHDEVIDTHTQNVQEGEEADREIR
jgi:hypothetical protein